MISLEAVDSSADPKQDPKSQAQKNPRRPSLILVSLLESSLRFDCSASPQAHPVFANTVEGLRYPFHFSLFDFGTLPDKPHKNIVRMLKGKPFRKPDISVTIQDLLDKAKSKSKDGLVVDVGANVGMATFVASAMGFQVLAFEPVLENLQKICEGIYFNRVVDLVTMFEAAASDRVGNTTVYEKQTCFSWIPVQLAEKESFEVLREKKRRENCC
ncbi:uncharacterized protein LOC124829166 [Vigna umbellata]|uniref:uncharacterized protein LOC124829166 n=1 Tax=Vigna umbellata TaxID=87088 RepID=UPI001F5E8D7C|nr:uncharacterized protein LOC124829166 [Vigna umbellata]